MELWAARACFALLWGCALAPATAAQGKEGECARRLAPWPPGPSAPQGPARLHPRNFGNRPGAAQSRRAGVWRAHGLRSRRALAPNRGHRGSGE